MRRILCIDGGGIKGTQPAAFLAGLEEDLDQPIGRYFDLIAGTSTGGILAIGLAFGIRAKTLLELYENRGPTIFGQAGDKSWIGQKARDARAALRHLIKPKHEASALRDELHAVLGDKLIGEAETRLLIPAWDADQRSVYIYKTSHHPRLTKDYRKPALDAAMATSAVPTYFARHKTVDDVGLLDGGTWCNNPVGVATVEAIDELVVSAHPQRSMRDSAFGQFFEQFVAGTVGEAIVDDHHIQAVAFGISDGRIDRAGAGRRDVRLLEELRQPSRVRR